MMNMPTHIDFATMSPDACLAYLKKALPPHPRYSNLTTLSHIKTAIKEKPEVMSDDPYFDDFNRELSSGTITRIFSQGSDLDRPADYEQDVFDLIVRELKGLVIEFLPDPLRRYVDRQVAIGVLHTTEVNAIVFPALNGHVIILNRGLLSLIDKFFYGYVLFMSRMKGKGAVSPQDSSVHMLISNLYQILATYVLTGVPSGAHDHAIMTTTIGEGFHDFHLIYVVHTVCFIIGHEIGHIKKKHFESSPLVLRTLHNIVFEAFRTSFDHEFEADEEADRIVTAMIRKGNVAGKSGHLKTAAKTSPIVFFMLLDLLEKVSGSVLGRQSTSETHPRPFDRVELLRKKRSATGNSSLEDDMFCRGVMALFDLFWQYIQKYNQRLREEMMRKEQEPKP